LNIWLVLWIVVSLVLLAFLGWTLFILYRQKSVWKAFAAKHKLRYKGNALMQSPEMDGTIGDYRVSYFTGEHMSPDMRGLRKLTAIEVNLNSVMPVDGGLASGGMVSLLKALEMKAEIRPDHKGWNQSYMAVSENRNVLDAYLTDERLELLTKLMGIKDIWVIFVFRNEQMLLRVDTPKPLISAEYLEKLSKLMVKAADALEFKPDESKQLKAEAARTVVKEKTVSLDDVGADGDVIFEFEDDEVEKPQVEDTPDGSSEEKPQEKSEEKSKSKKTKPKKAQPKSAKSKNPKS